MSREEDYTNITTVINLYFDVEELVYVNFNWKITNFNLILTITCTLFVLLVNSLVLLMLKMKEKTLVDRMVLLDCLANISTVAVMFLAFPIRIWGNSYICLLITFFRGFVVVLNRSTIHDYDYIIAWGVDKGKRNHFFLFRIIPLTVVVYRVLMVCYAEFCYQHGEKVLRDTLFRSDPLMSFFKAALRMIEMQQH